MTASLETWLAAVFDHPASGPEWYWGPEFDEAWDALDLDDAATVAYLTELFRQSDVLAPYSLEQVAKGIWFLIGDSSPAQPSLALIRTEVELAKRVACVRSMADFFSRYVSPSAPGAADTTNDPFHIACYMWWDIFPAPGGARGPEVELQMACLDVMRACLDMPSELCQLSGLHGLNHWHPYHRWIVEEAIDAFLGGDRERSSSIRSYAASARSGCCQ